MKRYAALSIALLLLGVGPAPAPLIVGVVRDQHGSPIGGATVRVRADHGNDAVATTAADGTFALEVTDARDAVITCAYCETTHADVDSGGHVVALVRRYDAVASATPTRSDVQAVPASDAAGLFALAPFVVLNRSSQLFPGPMLSDRGIARAGGLAIIDGTPSYDVVGELSPYYAVPRRYAGDASVRPFSDAYTYDSTAGGGTFILDPAHGASVYGGATSGVQAGTSDAQPVNAFAAFSSDAAARVARAALSADIATRSFTAGGGAAVSSSTVANNGDLDLSTASARGYVRSTGRIDAELSTWIDRGAYAAVPRNAYAVNSAWSDAAAQLTVRSRAVVAPFAVLSSEHRTGFWASAFPFAASVDESRAAAGISTSLKTFDAVAEAGVANARFVDETQTSYALRDALAAVAWHPSQRWSLESSVASGYRLPSLLAQYASPLLPDDSYTDRDRTIEGTLSYTDRSRVRVALTAIDRRTAGLDAGTTTSVGASLAWQIAPHLALRAWSLHVAPMLANKPAARFGVVPLAATPAVAWLTYDRSEVRVDLLWRRELIDWRAAQHLDAGISGPLANRLRWFVSTERSLRTTGVSAGVRF